MSTPPGTPSVGTPRTPRSPAALLPRAPQTNLGLYIRLIENSPWYHQFFCALALAQVLFQVVERSILLSAVITAPGSKDFIIREAIWFFVLIVLTAAFASYNAIHAVLTVNSYEMVAFFATTLLLCVRVVVEYAFNRSDECFNQNSGVCIGFLVTSMLFTVASLVLCGFMYNDLRWARYKAIGAEVHTRSMFRTFELFSALQSLDLQNAAVMLTTGVIFFSDKENKATLAAFVVNIVLFAVQVAWEVSGMLAVRRERADLMRVFWALSALLPTGILWVVVDFFAGAQLLRDAARDEMVASTMFVFALITLGTRAATVACSVILFRSYGERYRGLRRLLEGSNQLMQRFDRSRVRQMASGDDGDDADSGRGTVQRLPPPPQYRSGTELSGAGLKGRMPARPDEASEEEVVDFNLPPPDSEAAGGVQDWGGHDYEAQPPTQQKQPQRAGARGGAAAAAAARRRDGAGVVATVSPLQGVPVYPPHSSAGAYRVEGAAERVAPGPAALARDASLVVVDYSEGPPTSSTSLSRGASASSVGSTAGGDYAREAARRAGAAAGGYSSQYLRYEGGEAEVAGAPASPYYGSAVAPGDSSSSSGTSARVSALSAGTVEGAGGGGLYAPGALGDRRGQWSANSDSSLIHLQLDGQPQPQ